MIRDYFRVLTVDLTTGQGAVVEVEGRNEVAGGSGLAALLFSKYAHFGRPWDHPDQPLIFTIGPLTMSRFSPQALCSACSTVLQCSALSMLLKGWDSMSCPPG